MKQDEFEGAYRAWLWSEHARDFARALLTVRAVMREDDEPVTIPDEWWEYGADVSVCRIMDGKTPIGTLVAGKVVQHFVLDGQHPPA